jgi:hypothetical protein
VNSTVRCGGRKVDSFVPVGLRYGRFEAYDVRRPENSLLNVELSILSWVRIRPEGVYLNVFLLATLQHTIQALRSFMLYLYNDTVSTVDSIRGYIQKFPDWVDNEINSNSSSSSSNNNNNNNNNSWEATQSIMAAKLTRVTQNGDTIAPSGRELYHLQFSLHAANPETFGYSLVCCRMRWENIHEWWMRWENIHEWWEGKVLRETYLCPFMIPFLKTARKVTKQLKSA